MKNCKKKSQCVLASLLSVLSSGCCLNVKARERVAINRDVQNVQNRDSNLSLKKILFRMGLVVGTGFAAYKWGHNVVRHKLWEGSKELKGVDLSEVLYWATLSWFLDNKYPVDKKDIKVSADYEEENKKSITIYDISADWKGRKQTGKDLFVFGPNCYLAALLYSPSMFDVFDHVYLIDRSGYGMASENVDVPQNMDGLKEALNMVKKKLPANGREREILCFSMGGAEATELMKNDYFKRVRMWSPVDLKGYMDNSLTYRILSWLYSDLDVSWASNMIGALKERKEPLTVNVASGDMTDRLCAVKSLMNAAEDELGWEKPKVWDGLTVQQQADHLVNFYNHKFPGKLNLTVEIVKNMNHEGNVLMVQKLNEQEAQQHNDNPITPGNDDKTFFDYLIKYVEYAKKDNGENVNVEPLKKLLKDLKENSFSWGL